MGKGDADPEGVRSLEGKLQVCLKMGLRGYLPIPVVSHHFRNRHGHNFGSSTLTIHIFHGFSSSFPKTGWKCSDESLVADFQWSLWCTLHLVCGISCASTLEGGLPVGANWWVIRAMVKWEMRIPSIGRMTIFP